MERVKMAVARALAVVKNGARKGAAALIEEEVGVGFEGALRVRRERRWQGAVELQRLQHATT
jgi:hypothetical protein